MGTLFAKMAVESDYQEKRDRNRQNSRKAYDAILRFLPKARLTQEEQTEISGNLAPLKLQLQNLSESL